jgi:ABC-type multidrug transport system fused ATPase/permease subunit
MIDMRNTPVQMTSGYALRALYGTLSQRRRRQAWGTIVLMLVGALAEVVSVASVLQRPGSIPVVGGLIVNFPRGSNFVAITAVLFIALFIISGLIRLVLAWVSQSLAFNIAYDLSVTAFAKVIRQPYSYYVQRHSGEALSQFEKLHYITFSTLLSGIQALISSVVAALLILLLVAVNTHVALISAGLLVGTYLLISLGVQAILNRNSEAGSLHATLRIKRSGGSATSSSIAHSRYLSASLNIVPTYFVGCRLSVHLSASRHAF